MYSSSNYHQTAFDLPSAAPQQQQQMNDYGNYQRHDSMDYSRRPSYFTGLLGSTTNSSEASYSDHEQQTPSPFTGYEDYNQQQFHHPLDNSIKRRLSTTFELPHLYSAQAAYAPTTQAVVNPYYQQQRCNSSPMIYANPAVDMYSPQHYVPHPTQFNTAAQFHPLVVADNLVPSSAPLMNDSGIFRERASSSSSISSSDSALSLTATPSPVTTTRKTNCKATNKLNKPTRSRGRRVSNSPSIAGQKVFTCKHDDCGKVFKRSEHLKRHVRSIHTLEKPFECPYQSCSKRFSRSDNLNQHIRIHRHTGKDKNAANNSTSTAVIVGSSNSRNNSFSNYMPTY